MKSFDFHGFCSNSIPVLLMTVRFVFLYEKDDKVSNNRKIYSHIISKKNGNDVLRYPIDFLTKDIWLGFVYVITSTYEKYDKVSNNRKIYSHIISKKNRNDVLRYPIDFLTEDIWLGFVYVITSIYEKDDKVSNNCKIFSHIISKKWERRIAISNRFPHWRYIIRVCICNYINIWERW